MPSPKMSGLVVVVDDDEAIRTLLCELLGYQGFKTIGCANGQKALEVIQAKRPSAVTLDLHMPGMDGIEVLNRLSEDETTAGIPVVVVSAYSGDRRLRSQKQVRAVLTKPFDISQLCSTVERAASGSGFAA